LPPANRLRIKMGLLLAFTAWNFSFFNCFKGPILNFFPKTQTYAEISNSLFTNKAI